MTMQLGIEIPPHSLDAERSVLGSTLLDGAVWPEVHAIIAAEDFYLPAHRLIFDTIAALKDEGSAVDGVVVGERLVLNGALDEIGGSVYWQEIVDSVPTPAHAVYYANLVRDFALQREDWYDSRTKVPREVTEATESHAGPPRLGNRHEQRIFADTPLDEGDLRFAVSGILQITHAGLLDQFKLTVTKALRDLQARQANAQAFAGDDLGRYVAHLLHADADRCIMAARQRLVGTRQSVVLREIRTYLDMIRRQKDLVAEYFADCEAELRGDGVPVSDGPTERPVPPDTPRAAPLAIRGAAQVPVSVQLARAKNANQRRMRA